MRNGFDPDRAFLQLEEAAEEWAQARYQADLLEETQKIMLAEIAQGYVKEGARSHAEAENRAKADPRYRRHVEGMCAARQKSNRTQTHYKNLQALADMRRTEEASMRALTRP
jgi:multidrug resistance efflux pump